MKLANLKTPNFQKSKKDFGTAGKSFLILETILDSDEPLSISQIIKLTNISKPSTHRIVNLLCDFGLIERHQNRLGYQAGKLMIKMAHRALNNNYSSDLQTLLMDRLMNHIGETVNYGVFSGSKVTYVNRVEAKWPLGLRFDVGSQVPAHCTSIGKLMLALLDSKKLTIFLNSMELTRYTPYTITDPKRLRTQLTKIRKTEIGFDEQEFMDGVVCVAVPVRTEQGYLLGGLAASAPQARMTLQEMLDVVPDLKRTASEIANVYSWS